MLATSGRFAEAAEEASRAVALDPDGAGAWRFCEQIMRHSGRIDEADEGRRQLLRLKPLG